jgi:hypothetical protein
MSVIISKLPHIYSKVDFLNFINNYRYLFRAGVCGGNSHFTATIKMEEKYYKFDDMHYKGVFDYDSADFADSAIYSIMDD